MVEYLLRANAKINIGLNIVSTLSSGYHILDMVMVPIDLVDNITINIFDNDGDLTIRTNKKDIPTDKSNILFKVYDAFYSASNFTPKEINIYLEKIIPHEAGLGGGSSDGAVLLKILNKYYDNFFSEKELLDIGLKIGADIPFFIINKASRAGGIGEVLTPIINNLACKIIIVKPNFGVSTKTAYENVSKLTNKNNSNILSIIDGLENNDIIKIKNSVENHLEQGLLLTDNNITSFRKTLDKIKDHQFFMSGSGSAYFTFVSEHTKEEDLKSLQKRLINCEVFLCNFL